MKKLASLFLTTMIGFSASAFAADYSDKVVNLSKKFTKEMTKVMELDAKTSAKMMELNLEKFAAFTKKGATKEDRLAANNKFLAAAEDLTSPSRMDEWKKYNRTWKK